MVYILGKRTSFMTILSWKLVNHLKIPLPVIQKYFLINNFFTFEINTPRIIFSLFFSFSNSWEGEIVTGPHPEQRSTLRLTHTGKGKNCFLQWSLTEHLSILDRLQGRAHAHEQLANTKLTSWYFLCGLFVSFCFFKAFFALLFFCLFVLIFICVVAGVFCWCLFLCLWKREKSIMFLGWRGSGKN